MPHSLILGITQSGKSTLAQLFCAEFRRRKIATAVLDPMADPRWRADFVTRHAPIFLRYAKTHTRCQLFCDESGSTIGKSNPEMDWLGTTGRHYGHSVWLIAHRPAQLSVTLRNQCERVFLFAVGARDLDLLAEEWARPELRKLSDFRPGQFYLVPRFAEVQAGQIDFARRVLTMRKVAA